MIGTVETTKGFDVVLVVHVLLAIASLVVLAVLRAAALAASRREAGVGPAARSFTGRPELAGRVVHLVPVSGLALVALSRGVYTLSTGFVAVGLAGWVAIAALLEGVAFPAQREVAAALRAPDAPRAVVGRSPDAVVASRRMARALELAALVLVAVALVMTIGPSV